MRLTTTDHDRSRGGLRYVYPVVSRRAGGVSVGINLNTNNACNWRCVYCQVPGLVAGKAPTIELDVLERELEHMLGLLQDTDYMQVHVPEGARRIHDVAFSGNGEPTSSDQFPEAVRIATDALRGRGLHEDVKTVLITNGSLTHKPLVQAGLELLGAANGEVWFKVDSATEEGLRTINHAAADPERTLANLASATERCATWIQTCMFERAGEPPSTLEVDAYVEFLETVRARGIDVRGVLLYGLARPSHQPEASELAALPESWMEALAARIEATGTPCRLTP